MLEGLGALLDFFCCCFECLVCLDMPGECRARRLERIQERRARQGRS